MNDLRRWRLERFGVGLRRRNRCHVRKAQSLLALRVARELASGVYRLTLDPRLERHFGMLDQLRRSAMSIPANVAEGYALGTRAQFVRHVRIAFGSTAELQVHLQLPRDIALVEREAVEPLVLQCDRLLGLFIGLLKKLGARPPGT